VNRKGLAAFFREQRQRIEARLSAPRLRAQERSEALSDRVDCITVRSADGRKRDYAVNPTYSSWCRPR
jgi:hypothetical protein